MTSAQVSAGGSDTVNAQEFATAVASDLDMLAALHDREPAAPVVTALQQAPLQEQLSLVLKSEPALAALAAFALALDEVPRPVDAAALDELAAGYADVYLRYTYRASPEESVWLSEDELQRQAAMFGAREFYRRHSLIATDWAKRPEDHLVIELRFLARLMEQQDFQEAARFLDAHPLRWVRRFAVRLVQAGAPNWYAALALLTASYVEELRDYLVSLSGLERPKPEAERKKTVISPAEGPYMPGIAPSW